MVFISIILLIATIIFIVYFVVQAFKRIRGLILKHIVARIMRRLGMTQRADAIVAAINAPVNQEHSSAEVSKSKSAELSKSKELGSGEHEESKNAITPPSGLRRLSAVGSPINLTREFARVSSFRSGNVGVRYLPGSATPDPDSRMSSRRGSDDIPFREQRSQSFSRPEGGHGARSLLALLGSSSEMTPAGTPAITAASSPSAPDPIPTIRGAQT